jgi:hypothetical protein
LYLALFFLSFQKTIFKKAYYQKSLMKQIYFIIALLATVTLGILHLNSGIAFAQNETSQIEDSPLITSAQIDESMETNNTNYCFIAPILPGGIELMKKWNKENIVNNREHDAVFMDAGITREQVWIQHIPQQQNQDFAIACYETNDPEQSFKVLATSDKPWAVKFREHLKNAHGLDIAQSPMQINELVVNWKE